MPVPQFRPVIAIAMLLVIGCGSSAQSVGPASSKDISTQAPTPPISSPPPDPLSEPMTTPANTVAVETFLHENTFCRDVLEGLPLADFLTEYVTATQDREQSLADIGYVAYRDSMFMYEFLDKRLYAIRYVVPRSTESAEQWIEPFRDAFGPPTNTLMPADFRQMQASRFVSWDLPEHNLRIHFAYLPASFAEADLDLFGQFINIDRARESLTRMAQVASKAARAEKEQSPAETSIHQRVIQEQIADPEWGRVAATVNRLCAGRLPENEVHIQILKTIRLAQDGHFSPETTLRMLQQAEISGTRLNLSPVIAVQSCQQSLAFGAAANGISQ